MGDESAIVAGSEVAFEAEIEAAMGLGGQWLAYGIYL